MRVLERRFSWLERGFMLVVGGFGLDSAALQFPNLNEGWVGRLGTPGISLVLVSSEFVAAGARRGHCDLRLHAA